MSRPCLPPRLSSCTDKLAPLTQNAVSVALKAGYRHLDLAKVRLLTDPGNNDPGEFEPEEAKA